MKPGPMEAAILRLSLPQFPLLRVVCYSQRFTKCLPEGHFLFWYIGFLSASHHPIQEACFSSLFRAPNSCGYLVLAWVCSSVKRNKPGKQRKQTDEKRIYSHKPPVTRTHWILFGQAGMCTHYLKSQGLHPAR